MHNLNWVLMAIAAIFCLVSYVVKSEEDRAGMAGVGIGLALSALIVTLLQAGN